MKKLLIFALGLVGTAQAQAQEPSDSLLREKTLKELTIKSNLPKQRVKGDAMRTLVGGSVLEQTASATEMLKYIPNVQAESGSVSVFGRGDAEVYVNGRKLHDLKELDNILPQNIQFVDVVANPGVRYSASTRAVIRITMKRPQGEGFGFANSTYFSYDTDWTLMDQLDMNYRKGGLDVTATLHAMRYATYQDQLLTFQSLTPGGQVHKQVGDNDTDVRLRTYAPKVQFNYIVNKNHSFGAWYNYNFMPYQKANATLNTQIYLDDVTQENTVSMLCQDWTMRNHSLSMYYNGLVKDWTIDFNADGVFTHESAPSVTTEDVRVPGVQDVHSVVSNDNEDETDLYAAKFVLSRPLWGGQLSFGSEFSYSDYAYSYKAKTEVEGMTSEVPLQEHDNKESIEAGFLEYGRLFGKVQANVGLRYEHVRSRFFTDGVKDTDGSRVYNDWFPSVSLAMPVGPLQMSLSYAQDVTRPAYESLNYNKIYVNRYTNQCGNPKLRPMYAHNLVLQAAYKWVTLMAEFSRNKDAMSVVAMDDPDPLEAGKTLLVSQNINAFNQGNISLTLAPVIKQVWRPQLTAQLTLQRYEAEDLFHNSLVLNRPLVTLQWQNFISLPKGFLFMPNVTFNSNGDQGNMRIHDNICTMSFSLRKSFLKNKMDVTLNATNPFELADQNVTIYGGRQMGTDQHVHRSFFAQVVYKFNESRSKYKGTGAGNAQKARIK